MSKEVALAAKTRGNDAFTKGDFATAVAEFTAAIEADPTDAVFYSNRSGAYASLKQYEEALSDANKCVELKPSFVKGYTRQGVAHFGLSQFTDAADAYEAGLKVDPTNAALKDGLADVQSQMMKSSAKAENPLGSLFGPDMWVKLNANPVTREYMKDPSFVQQISNLGKDPRAMGSIGQDPRMSQALGVILGMGTEGFSAMSGDQAKAPGGPFAGRAPQSAGGATVEDDDEDMDSDDDTASGVVKDEKPKPKFKQVAEMTPEEAKIAREATYKAAGREMPKELTPEEMAEQQAKAAEQQAKAAADKAKAQVRAAADKEKNAGNELYKKRDFPGAIAKYEAAIAADSTNIVYYTNLSAVYMETKEFKKVIEVAQKGVDVGKQNMANYVDVAKALARIGAAYQGLGDLDSAADYYNKSLLEDYNDKTKQLLKKLEADRKKAAEAAYIDPVKSEEHKVKGNELYGAGKFTDAIVEYTEALKRDPTNYKVYSNRANCFSKMMDWGRVLEDCEKCLSIDPKFVKAYIRKGKTQHFLKQYHKALSTYDAALEIEPGNQEVLEAKRATMIAIQNSDSDPDRAKEAMKDPEIQAILRDPTISKVLQDLQNNPAAGQAAMRDPDIRKKIEKLIAAGVLGVK